jgi:hypothetical protein
MTWAESMIEQVILNRYLPPDVKDVKFESDSGTIIRELIAAGKGRQSYFARLALADEIYFKRLTEP